MVKQGIVGFFLLVLLLLLHSGLLKSILQKMIGNHIYFVTPKTTRKYANLAADHRVALMVNSSTNQISDFHQAISVTAVGNAEEIGEAEKVPIAKRYLAKHPHLEDFVRAPTCALVGVSVKTYYLVKNFQNVMELHLEP